MKPLLKNLLSLVLLGLFGWLALEQRAAASLVVAFVFCWIQQMLLLSKFGRLTNFIPLGPVLMTAVMAHLSTWWAAALAAAAGHVFGLLWVWLHQRRELRALAQAEERF